MLETNQMKPKHKAKSSEKYFFFLKECVFCVYINEWVLFLILIKINIFRRGKLSFIFVETHLGSMLLFYKKTIDWLLLQISWLIPLRWAHFQINWIKYRYSVPLFPPVEPIYWLFIFITKTLFICVFCKSHV